MSLRELLRRRKAATVPRAPCATESQGTAERPGNQQGSPGYPSSLANDRGRTGQELDTASNDSERPAFESDIDLLLENLRFDFTGAPLHDIDEELVQAIRQAMLPMGMHARAELAASLDYLLAEPDGRRQALSLLHVSEGIRHIIDWIDWVCIRCPLLDDDVAFLRLRLHQRPYSQQTQMAWRYVNAWRTAVTTEPQPTRKENAGRRAANLTLPPLQGHESLRREGLRPGVLNACTAPHPGWYHK
ncbi:MAG: hypothetical protein ACQEXI_16215 [Pseudomonadota bacterium]